MGSVVALRAFNSPAVLQSYSTDGGFNYQAALSGSLPSGSTEGDLCVIQLWSGTGVAPQAEAGWELLTEWIPTSVGATGKHFIYWKRLGPADVDVSFYWPSYQPFQYVGWSALTFSGATTIGTPFESLGSAPANSYLAYTPQNPNTQYLHWPAGVPVTTSGDGRCVVQFYAQNQSYQTYPGASGWVESYESSAYAGGPVYYFQVQTTTAPTAGIYQTPVVNMNGYGTEMQGGYLAFAVLPEEGILSRLTATEGQDTYAGALFNPPVFRLGATEARDTFDATLLAPTTISLGATEARDTFASQLSLPTFVGAGNFRSGTTPSFFGSTVTLSNIDYPGDANEGDAAFLFIQTAGNNVTHATPSGWTLLHNTWVDGASPNRDYEFSVYFRRVPANKASFNWTSPNLGNSRSAGAVIAVYSGFSEDPEPYEGGNGALDTTDATISGVPVTVTEPGSLVLQFTAYNQNTTLTAPSGWTERYDFGIGPNSSSHLSFYLADQFVTSAGTVAAPAFTPASTAGDYGYSFGLALKPLPAPVILPEINLTVTEERDTYGGSLETAVTEATVTLRAIEGRDAFAGTLGITGELSLSGSDRPDNYSGSYNIVSTVQVVGSEARDQFSGSVQATTPVALGATEARDTITAAFAITSSLNLSGGEPNDTFAGSITAEQPGLTLSGTEARDAYAGSFGITSTVSLAGLEGNDAFNGSVKAVTTVVLAGTEESDVFDGAVGTGSPWRLSVVEAPDTLVGAINVAPHALTLAGQEAEDAFGGSVGITSAVTLAVGEQNDVFAGSVRTVTQANLTATEGPDTFSGQAGIVGSMTLAGLEGQDVLAGSTEIVSTIQFAGIDALDGFQAVMDLGVGFGFGAVEANDNFAGAVQATTPARLAATESTDVFAGQAEATTPLHLGATDAHDTLSGRVEVSSNVQIGAVEGHDVFIASMAVVSTVYLAGREAIDLFQADIVADPKVVRFRVNDNAELTSGSFIYRDEAGWIEPHAAFIKDENGQWILFYGFKR